MVHHSSCSTPNPFQIWSEDFHMKVVIRHFHVVFHVIKREVSLLLLQLNQGS